MRSFYIHVLAANKKAQARLYLLNNTIDIGLKRDEKRLYLLFQETPLHQTILPA